MLPTHYLKRSWFWLGMGTGALALAGLIAWLWKTRPHGPNIEPVQIDFSFVRPPTRAASSTPAPVEQGNLMAPAEAAREVVAAAQLPAVAAVVPAAPDDLVALVGIGPRIAAILREAGFGTFAQLAQADPAALRELLQANNLRLADPASWPEQARLAAAGKWKEIKQIAALRRSPRGRQ